MSATAKSTTPISPATNESKDWTKAATPELQSSSKDEASVLDAKVKERRCRKQVRREERLQWEEAERLARKEVEHAKVEAERKAREQAEKERVDLQARAESEQRKVVEVAAKQRVGEVATKQKKTVQEASKKRARDEPEAGPVSFTLIHFYFWFC